MNGTITLRRILLVEDEPALRAVTKVALEKLGGFTVLDCDSGRTALESAADFRPDLVLLDVMMPDMDGPTTLGALRAIIREVPVLFLTAKVRAKEVAELQRFGAIGVVQKPFDPLRLSQQILERWNAHQAKLPADSPESSES